MDLTDIILVVFFIWLLAISYFAVWIFQYFKKLSVGVDKGNLIRILENILAKKKNNSKLIDDLSKHISKIEDDARYHIQKIGVVRFNPFKELGGDHSFSLALLDGMDNGFVVTGLHTRERTRVYVKVVRKGKSEVELSSEESKALKVALKS